ncbi:hypothetical protein H4R20_006181, partial [Coemansia guatemalensis]
MNNSSVVHIKHGPTSVSIEAFPELAGRLLNIAQEFDKPESDTIVGEIELFALFLEHCVEDIGVLALGVFDEFIRQFCTNGCSIHVAVQEHGLGEESARAVLRAYYSLWKFDEAKPRYRNAAVSAAPALLASSSAHLMAMFGG